VDIDGSDPSGQIPAPGDQPDREIEAGEARRLVAEALGDLEPPGREIILLREAEGLSYQELAETLGVPLGTVQSRLARAREALRDAVRRRHPDWKP
jgi:RNA polymerase sigma-70 factor (ECF subfamily)